MMTNTDSEDRGVKSVHILFRIIEQLMTLDGAGVTELADEVGIAKSTVHDHLSTLRELGYVINEGSEYALSLRFLRLGRYVRRRKNLYEVVEEEVREIAETTEQRTQFIAREGRFGIPLLYVSGKKGMPYIGFTIGEPLSLHATASGKAIFAHLPEEMRENLFQTEFKQFTEHTITDTEKLRKELETIRQRGYAFNREESFSGLSAVAMPIRDEKDEVLGSISISGPTHKFSDDWLEDELPDLLRGSVNEIELKLQHL